MRKGQKLGFIPQKAFKKGQIPHNKGKIFLSTKLCEYCKNEFTVRGKKPLLVKKYCSRLCSGYSKKGKESSLKGIPRTKEVIEKIRNKNKGKHRSIEMKKLQSKIKKGKHLSFNTEFKKGHSAPKTAFKRNDIRLIKANNPNWRGGISTEIQKIRGSIENDIWRSGVFSRDGYTDQKTGIKGGKLTAHHIKNFAQYPELRFAIDNGITLSHESHKEFHKKYGKKNNTREQIEEFIKD